MIYLRFDNRSEDGRGFNPMGGLGHMLTSFSRLVAFLEARARGNYRLYAPYSGFKPSHMEDDERKFVLELFDPLRKFQSPYEVRGKERPLRGDYTHELGSIDPEQDHFFVIEHIRCGPGSHTGIVQKNLFGHLGIQGPKRERIENVVIQLRRGDLAFYQRGGKLHDNYLDLRESCSHGEIAAKHRKFTMTAAEVESLTGLRRMNAVRQDIVKNRTSITSRMCEMLVAAMSSHQNVTVISDGYLVGKQGRKDYRQSLGDKDQELHELRRKGLNLVVKGEESHIENTWNALAAADLVISPTAKSVALLPSLLGAHVLPLNSRHYAGIDAANDRVDLPEIRRQVSALKIPFEI